MDPRNEAVLRYLEVERVAPPDTNGAWVKDGYSLATHPELCDRVKELNEAAGAPAEFRYVNGKPALVAANGVIVAFGGGTYVFALRLARGQVELQLRGKIHDDAQRLQALTSRDWTLVDPWAVHVPRGEGLRQLAALIGHAVEEATR